MKIEKSQTNITLDLEELSTIENAITILNDLVTASEDECETEFLGRCGQELTYGELRDVVDVLEAIIDARGEFTLR